ncbi:MAG TPA: VOC family protein [Thermoanaerobaculia bacterium]
MPEMNDYKPGTFCWTELSTNDRKAAAQFYGALLGWEAKEQPMGPDDVYVMLSIGGKTVGALYQDTKSGAPPHWNCYVAVTSADDAAEKAKSLGGNIVAGPMDVFEAGRMAVIADPVGAVLAVWQPGYNKGAELYRENGALCWNELLTHNEERARNFYTSLFGWTAKVSPEYTELHLGEEGIAGIFPMQGEMFANMPEVWMPYFAVADCDASTAKVKSLGGHVMKEPSDIPNVGRFSVAGDPQGAMFNLFQAKM